MSRFFTTLATMLFLSSLYFLYSAIVVPLTSAQEARHESMLVDASGYYPPALSNTAEKYFPEAEWLQGENIKTLESKNTFFFTRDLVRIVESGDKVQMSPIAMLWKDPRHPEKAPFRVIAEVGIVQFENKFFDSALNLSDAKPGRIVWASLEGPVHIDGPDGLEIDGRQFNFSEESGLLYSDEFVQFHYGPTLKDRTEVSGEANSLDISLTQSDEAVLGEDLPRVSGVSLITLRRNVKIDAVFFKKGVRHEAHLTSEGPFVYDVLRQHATFNNNVKLTHLHPKGNRTLADRLSSERLDILFESTQPLKPDADPAEFFDDLNLRQVRAAGSTGQLGAKTTQVQIESEKHNLSARMQDLTYDLITRTATLLDPQRVLARRGDVTFSCPNIRIVHSEENQLSLLECEGPGQLLVSHERLGNARAEAAWGGRLDVYPDQTSPFHIVQMTQQARMVLPKVQQLRANRDLEMDLSADQVRLWVDLEKAQSMPELDEILKTPLPIHKSEARGNVVLTSPDLVVDRTDAIHVSLSAGDVAKKDSKIVRTGNAVPESAAPRQPSNMKRGPLHVEVDQMQIELVHDATTGQVAMRNLNGEGHVRIMHTPEPNASLREIAGDSPVVLSGTRIVAESEHADDQRVTLLGVVDEFGDVKEPAEMSFGPARIRGANLGYDRLKNQVAIFGPGVFHIPVTRDFSGNKLDEPAILEILWQEQMVFDGLEGRFLKTVSCTLKGHEENISRMDCEDLTVRLNQRIALQESRNRPKDIDLESIHARHQVKVQMYEFSENKPVAFHQGELTEFRVNQTTGDFVGLGSGEVHSWTKGDQLKLAPTDSAEANQPISSKKESGWRYSRIQFSGKFTGNMQSKSAVFERQRIQILSAPVPQIRVEFDVNDVSNVENAVRLDCNQLKIFQREFDDQGYWELFAQNVNELEGKYFRAVADELVFDERLGRFILRGIGKDATLYFQERPGANAKPSFHRYIEFIPKKRSINVDGSSGLSN